MSEKTETLEGYVVDLACLRKYPRGELAERARVHSRACALMGHCLESGYGLVDEEGYTSLLDMESTLMVLDAIRGSGKEKGIRLRARREMRDEKMQTVSIEVV